MLHIPGDARVKDPNENVTGGHARLERIVALQQPNGASLALVHFENGAVTHWHTHPGDQILYVVAGECRVGNATGEVVIARTGDAVYIPPGEKHWHGAVAGTNMSHLSITTVGPPEWLEPVEDADLGAA